MFCASRLLHQVPQSLLAHRCSSLTCPAADSPTYSINLMRLCPSVAAESQNGRGEGGTLFPQTACGSNTVPCCYSSSMFLSGYFEEASLSTTSAPLLSPRMALPPTHTSYHNILHLCSAQPMSADVNDVVQPSCQLVVALTGTIHAIPSEKKPCSGQNRAMVTCCSEHVRCSPAALSPHPLLLSVGTRAHVLCSFLSGSG